MKSFCWANAFLHAKQNSKNRTLNSLKTEMLRQDTLCLFIPDLNTTNAKQRAHKYISLLHYNTHVYIYSTCLTCLGLHPENRIHFMTTKFTQHHWLIILLSLPTNFLTVNPDFCLSQPFSLSTLASQLRIRAGTAEKDRVWWDINHDTSAQCIISGHWLVHWSPGVGQYRLKIQHSSAIK